MTSSRLSIMSPNSPSSTRVEADHVNQLPLASPVRQAGCAGGARVENDHRQQQPAHDDQRQPGKIFGHKAHTAAARRRARESGSMPSAASAAKPDGTPARGSARLGLPPLACAVGFERLACPVPRGCVERTSPAARGRACRASRRRSAGCRRHAAAVAGRHDDLQQAHHRQPAKHPRVLVLEQQDALQTDENVGDGLQRRRPNSLAERIAAGRPPTRPHQQRGIFRGRRITRRKSVTTSETSAGIHSTTASASVAAPSNRGSPPARSARR